MKRLFLILLGVAALACQPDEFPAIGGRDKVLPKLSGTWTLNRVIQNDNDAERKGFPMFAQTQDVTNDFPFSEFSITLNVDAAGSPTTYNIVTGNSPNIIGDVTSGNWTVDDVDFPSKILFDEVSIELGSFAELNNGNMQFKLIRYLDEQSVVTYQYIFIKE